MKTEKHILKSEKETAELAKQFAHTLKGGEVVSLIGEVGAGKTFFVQQIAKELDVKDKVVSPSFILFKKYSVKGNKDIKYLCHYDWYRISNPTDVIDLAVLDNFHNEDTVCFIEWAKMAKKFIPGDSIDIFFDYGKHEKERIIELPKISA